MHLLKLADLNTQCLSIRCKQIVLQHKGMKVGSDSGCSDGSKFELKTNLHMELLALREGFTGT